MGATRPEAVDPCCRLLLGRVSGNCRCQACSSRCSGRAFSSCSVRMCFSGRHVTSGARDAAL